MLAGYAEARNIVFPETARAQRYSCRQMKGNMSKTIQAMIERTAPTKPIEIPLKRQRLTATWQNGLESGGLVQRKLRLGFGNALAQGAVN